jgi:UDP-N-acetylmuramoyl-L-alanyl-D-glutamate--2,6-diaminopimelate ligase
MTQPTLAIADIIEWLRARAASAHLSSDSRRIEAGDVFLAYPGDANDGRSYVAQAIERGAAAVLHDDAAPFAWNESWRVPHLAIADLKRAAGDIAAHWYGKPDASMYSVAVTGTNGKTSCTQWLAYSLSQLGGPAAVIGTLGVGLYRLGRHSGLNTTGYTTPDAVMLQRELAALRRQGATALAIEASSIGLDQGRLNGMHFDVALFTNLTRDHLDYHGTMQTYEAAKAKLFDWPGLQHAVINLDDEMGMRLAQTLQQRTPRIGVMGYTVAGNGLPELPMLEASDIRYSHTGTVFQLRSPAGSAQIRTQLVGQFNVSNVLGIAGVLWAKGIPWSDIIEALESLEAVPGRMQQLGGHDAPLVLIDYAHTPDALEKALTTLRQVAQQRGGKLWCVFGCGGDRDAGKRPVMGSVSLNADNVVVTSDNPRSEEPGAIIAQIREGMGAAEPEKVQVIEDRAAAILWAVKHAGRTDVILLAGKGHEDYQEIKGRKLPFLDADHAALALASRATMRGI